jgi:hypothetical protein
MSNIPFNKVINFEINIQSIHIYVLYELYYCNIMSFIDSFHIYNDIILHYITKDIRGIIKCPISVDKCKLL